jgi:cell division protein ZapA (FtsZ GTPase activity inhibitor)
MKGTHSIEVKLLGQKIVLRTAGDPELVREVVDLVTIKLRESEGRGKSPAPHHVALLALLDLAEEYVKAKRRAADHRQQVDDKSRELLGLLEAEFK